ncbi:DUF484 family protein [Azohydromonas caseinilytica]|uniref:DUF484 family protein n=1 Tax=Azohydromonas caseinilytica TaxID=2728836 RepID=A0A848F5L8_9BURK|nr:DUF484 family protein [Azohydromonas caseinilytica]NML13590.1 DUF484 family protein [Azohydromonas caseinilytica]
MSGGIDGITEDDLAQYLSLNPGFFERHAELLGEIRLASPHGGRAVSLQERQAALLRERIKGLEQRLMEMIRHGQENTAIAERLHAWTRAVMLQRDSRSLPLLLVEELKQQFLVPQAALRLWDVDVAYASEGFVLAEPGTVRGFADELALPLCALNTGEVEAAQWLFDGTPALSIACVPLRHDSARGAFGLLMLGSPDATRFQSDMGVDFLVRIGDIASAALSRLLPR